MTWLRELMDIIADNLLEIWLMAVGTAFIIFLCSASYAVIFLGAR